MDGATLYTLNTSILGGRPLDETVFYQFLNMAKNTRELSRDWMKLRVVDHSITFSSSDAYDSTKTLPDRFLKQYSYRDQMGALKGPFIVTADGSKVELQPIKLEEAYDFRNLEGYYYIDYAAGKIGRTGSTAGTLYLPYIRGTEDIASGTSWTMPPTDTFGILLAFDVAILQKGGIDWDTVNANQVPYNRQTIRDLESRLALWDAQLQQAQLGV